MYRILGTVATSFYISKVDPTILPMYSLSRFAPSSSLDQLPTKLWRCDNVPKKHTEKIILLTPGWRHFIPAEDVVPIQRLVRPFHRVRPVRVLLTNITIDTHMFAHFRDQLLLHFGHVGIRQSSSCPTHVRLRAHCVG